MTEEVMLRTSERKAFRGCPQAWAWGYLEGLQAKGRPAAPLWFGTGIHYALAAWYKLGRKRGPRPAKTFAAWIDAEGYDFDSVQVGRDQDDKAEFEDAKVLGVSMLTRYVEHYGRDEDLEFLAVEQPFQVDILDSDGQYVVTAVGTFDGAAYDNIDDTIYLPEHKTAASIATAFLALDDQAGTYFAVGTQVLRAQGLIGPNEAIDGVLYNYLRKAKPDDRPQNELGRYLNKDGTESKRQPAPEFHREVVERTPGEVNAQLRRIRDDALWMKAVREGTMPVIKNTTPNCPRCHFFELCQLDERGDKRAFREFKKAAFVHGDPWADHRKSAE